MFCAAPELSDDSKSLIVARGETCYVILNLYPYTNGHLMIVPFAHLSMLSDLPSDAATELIELAKMAQLVLAETYRPNGFNIGLNLGEAAGAGIAQHLHLHVVPRWIGDANFMTVTGETRVHPEALDQTFARLSAAFAKHKDAK